MTKKKPKAARQKPAEVPTKNDELKRRKGTPPRRVTPMWVKLVPFIIVGLLIAYAFIASR